MHEEILRSSRNSKILKLARGSFSDFLYLMMLGLIFLVPFDEPLGLAIALFVMGTSRLVGLARQILIARRSNEREKYSIQFIRKYGLPALGMIGMLVIAVEILNSNMIAVYALVFVVAMLLTSASWNAWLILVHKKDE